MSKNSKKECFSENFMGYLLHWKYLNDVSDEMMSDYLGVQKRTFKSYYTQPERMTLGQLDSFLERNNLTFSNLIEKCSQCSSLL